MNTKPNRITTPRTATPGLVLHDPKNPGGESYDEFNQDRVIEKIAALVGMDKVETAAVLLAAGLSSQGQGEFVKDILLAAAESLVSELGHGQISLR